MVSWRAISFGWYNQNGLEVAPSLSSSSADGRGNKGFGGGALVIAIEVSAAPNFCILS